MKEKLKETFPKQKRDLEIPLKSQKIITVSGVRRSGNSN
jgi:hypothetical protein